MEYSIVQPTARAELWALIRSQHGVVTRRQLLARGFSEQAIQRRIANGRLHPIFRGVYAVGRPELTPRGRGLAAVLSCGPQAVLSHESAGALWGIRANPRAVIDVCVPANVRRRHPGIRVRRRAGLRPEHVAERDRIPVTCPALTLADLAAILPRTAVEAAVNQADRLELIDPEALRVALAEMPRWPGVAALRRLLDRRTFALTDSELERRFRPISRAAGLPPPLTQQLVNGFKVDFYWPELGLVVETDGLRYHRTPADQATDRLRDQAHTAAGMAHLRFTHEQIHFRPGQVKARLATTLRTLRARPGARAL